MNTQAREVREGSFGLLIKRLQLKIEKELGRRLVDLGLNVRTFGIVMLLLEGEGLTQRELGARVGVPGYSTTRALDELEELGVLERRPHPTSRRAHHIHLTAKGRRYRDDLPRLIEGLNEEFLAPCSKRERVQLQSSLKKILEQWSEL